MVRGMKVTKGKERKLTGQLWAFHLLSRHNRVKGRLDGGFFCCCCLFFKKGLSWHNPGGLECPYLFPREVARTVAVSVRDSRALLDSQEKDKSDGGPSEMPALSASYGQTRARPGKQCHAREQGSKGPCPFPPLGTSHIFLPVRAYTFLFS